MIKDVKNQEKWYSTGSNWKVRQLNFIRSTNHKIKVKTITLKGKSTNAITTFLHERLNCAMLEKGCIQCIYVRYAHMHEDPEDRIAGYWPSSFLAFLWTETTQNWEWGHYPAMVTKQAWSIQDLSYGRKNTKEYDFITSCQPCELFTKFINILVFFVFVPFEALSCFVFGLQQ